MLLLFSPSINGGHLFPWAANPSAGAENLGGDDDGEMIEAQFLAVSGVASIHMGWGSGEQFGGGNKSVEGRLWRYESGGLGFFWILKNGNRCVSGRLVSLCSISLRRQR